MINTFGSSNIWFFRYFFYYIKNYHFITNYLLKNINIDSYESGMFKLKQAQYYSDVETGSELDSKKRSRHERVAKSNLLLNSLTTMKMKSFY